MNRCALKEFIYSKHQKGDYIAPHKHAGYELIYYVVGEGVTSIGMEEIPYTGDTIQIVAPGTLHYDMSDSPTKVRCCVFDCYDIKFPNITITKTERNEKQFEQILKQMYLLEDLLVDKDSEETLDVNYMDDAIGKAYSHEEIDIVVENEMWFTILILIHLIEQSHITQPDTQRSVDYIKKYIKDNFSSTINFEILSQKIGYSYDRFRHVFKEKTGVSLKKYQQGIRIARAKTYLEETSVKIKKIAKKCGFNSDTRFMLFFKEKVGLTPSEYREIMLDKPEMFNIKNERAEIERA